ncbi:hypothetical protein BDF14DRAFT_1800854 [Spinellus fusiger]|nr:hypothetical protein BDF14DRAFT_1800854 [Spinellus fusiger]
MSGSFIKYKIKLHSKNKAHQQKEFPIPNVGLRIQLNIWKSPKNTLLRAATGSQFFSFLFLNQ